MLLAINPSILERLGLSLGDLVDMGDASWKQTKSTHSGAARIFALASHAEELGDLNRELLTAEKMAERMKCSKANVYDREKKGTLFSVLPPGRENGRRYPVFQLHSRLDSTLLTELIGQFRAQDAPTNLLWEFLRSVQASLGNLTGVEFLTGQRPARDGINSAVIEKLASLNAERRRAYVVEHALEGLQYALT